MAEQPMDPLWRTALWQQFGAAIAMLENALLACPSTHWHGRLWSDQKDPEYPAFWSITYHTLFWLDLYLTGRTAAFAPPAPFLNRLDEAADLPERPYSREELHGYLVHLRQKCQTTIAELTDEQAHQPFTFPWPGGMSVSFFELLLDTMRNVWAKQPVKANLPGLLSRWSQRSKRGAPAPRTPQAR